MEADGAASVMTPTRSAWAEMREDPGLFVRSRPHVLLIPLAFVVFVGVWEWVVRAWNIPTFLVPAPSTVAEYSVFASVVTSHPAEPQMYRCRLLGISHYHCRARSCCESAWAFADLFPSRPVSG